jgi:hypothetical protein
MTTTHASTQAGAAPSRRFGSTTGWTRLNATVIASWCASDGADVRLLTRSGLDWTGRFGTMPHHCRQLGARAALIDGEAPI